MQSKPNLQVKDTTLLENKKKLKDIDFSKISIEESDEIGFFSKLLGLIRKFIIAALFVSAIILWSISAITTTIIIVIGACLGSIIPFAICAHFLDKCYTKDYTPNTDRLKNIESKLKKLEKLGDKLLDPKNKLELLNITESLYNYYTEFTNLLKIQKREDTIFYGIPQYHKTSYCFNLLKELRGKAVKLLEQVVPESPIRKKNYTPLLTIRDMTPPCNIKSPQILITESTPEVYQEITGNSSDLSEGKLDINKQSPNSENVLLLTPSASIQPINFDTPM